ncbi:nucleotidyl transferase AbiEii/AbiGii toxin family protein [Cupriavidus basilensis]
MADRAAGDSPLRGGRLSQLLRGLHLYGDGPFSAATFWEKATALHAEAHRPTESPTPQYLSRHYYDLAMLFDSEEGKAAATDFGLLAQVVTHKATFFRSSWARYDIAQPGTLRLVPNEARVKDLRVDYRTMAPMMFDENPPSFEDILARIEVLERNIND